MPHEKTKDLHMQTNQSNTKPNTLASVAPDLFGSSDDDEDGDYNFQEIEGDESEDDSGEEPMSDDESEDEAPQADQDEDAVPNIPFWFGCEAKGIIKYQNFIFPKFN